MTQNSTLASTDVAGPTTTGSGYIVDLEEEEPSLPMYRCINPRSIVKPEQIDLNEIALKCKAIHIDKHLQKTDTDPNPVSKTALPVPKYPLTLMWNPAVINFELECERVVNRLRLFNSCIRPIYIQIYGLLDQNARLGASWCCRPRTRILLAPGMIFYLAITATPRKESPIPLAHVGLQLSATHMRDIVVGYFVVPMKVKFLNYKEINYTEESTKDLNHTDYHYDGESETTALVVTDTEAYELIEGVESLLDKPAFQFVFECVFGTS